MKNHTGNITPPFANLNPNTVPDKRSWRPFARLFSVLTKAYAQVCKNRLPNNHPRPKVVLITRNSPSGDHDGGTIMRRTV